MMHTQSRALRAYASADANRSTRDQEADVFRRASAALRAARAEGLVGRLRALADNRRLWIAVTDLVRDPENGLPTGLRADIASLGLAVQRVMDAPAPDLDFLIEVNENMAEGLGARPVEPAVP
jgi:flagellar biosynthesis regulator FlaF